MKIVRTIALFALSLCALVSACGPSPAQQAATATQGAVDKFKTQTALAPTSTPSPTVTPTSIVTPTPTLTPTATHTPTVTPTPMPEWMGAGLVLEDLPEGFRSMTDEELSVLKAKLPQNSIAFGYVDEVSSQGVMGYYYTLPSRAEQMSFDRILPDTLGIMAFALGATVEPESIPGLNEIGEARHSYTFAADGSGFDLRYEMILFRRGETAAFLLVFCPDGDEPVAPLDDLARLLDGRLNQ